MDSGNSGSLQSSSGGDEEYDSRAESISAFFNTPTPTPTTHHPPHFFDTLSSYLDSSIPNPFLNPYPTPHNPNPTSTTTTTTTNPPPPPQPQQPSTIPPRTSKKRSRASRRAPTTVLTTDTSNFRAMVQEFTGIPNPPFSAVPRPRFDLFRSPADMAPPYILRPFAHKSTANTSSSSHNITPPPITTTTTSTNPNNYQNSLLDFQSLLQSSNYTTTTTLPAIPTFTTRPPASSNYGDLGLVIASEGTQSGWTGGDRAQLRSVMGNYEASQRASGCKLNYSAKDSTSAEKAVESVNPARSEGMMDSWICTSD